MKPLGLGWPNIVSAGRVVLVPALVGLLMIRTRRADLVAAALFVAGALSDGLDGWLARRHAMTTSTGAWLDPLSDKLFVAAPIVALVTLDRFPAWAAVVIIGREVAVSLLRWRLDAREITMPASTLAKWKTGTQLLAVFLSLLPLGARWRDPTHFVIDVAVALTLYTGAEYFLTTRHRVRTR